MYKTVKYNNTYRPLASQELVTWYNVRASWAGGGLAGLIRVALGIGLGLVRY